MGKLPLPYRVADDAIQGNFDELAKHFPLSRKDIQLESPHNVGDAGEPAFLNSWINQDTTVWTALRFWKDPLDMVHIEGAIKNGSPIYSTIFVLPAGYRPALGHTFVITYNGVHGRVEVAPTGNVSVVDGGAVATLIFLSGISFRRAN